MITSLQHPLVKHFVRLRQNRDYREEHGTAMIEGFKMVSEMCQTFSPTHCLMTEEKEGFKPTHLVSPEVMQKICATPNPEGVVAEVPMAPSATLQGKKWVVALDGISDPGNLGTVIRTALALGWEGLFLLNNCCDPYNDKALRAAKGATFRLPMRSGSWEELQQLKLPLFAADLNGTSIKDLSFPKSMILILGSEAHGLSETIKAASSLVTIPQQGAIDSLNVAIAGAILMYLARQ